MSSGKCPTGLHFLQAAVVPSRWTCDSCKQQYPQTEQSWGCRQCNFDECTNCMNAKIAASGYPQQQQQTDRDGLVQNNDIIDITSCDKGHPFVLANLGGTTRWKCDFCTQTYSGGTSYGCRACNVDLCQACYNKQSTKQQEKKQQEDERLRKEQQEKAKQQQAAANAILLAQQTAAGKVCLCPTGHPLHKGTLPATVTWKCDKCFQVKVGGGSWGCRICNFDECQVCAGSKTSASPTTTVFTPPTPQPATTTMTTINTNNVNITTDVPCWQCRKPLNRCPLPNIIWKCDKCFKDHRGGTSFGCRACNKDACSDCYEQLKSGGGGSTPNTISTSTYGNNVITSAAPSFTATLVGGLTAGFKPPAFLPSFPTAASNTTTSTPVVTPSPMSQVSQQVSSNPSNKPTCYCLLIGINYPGSKAELRGCHNDVVVWMKMLTHLGFDISNRRVLIDDRAFRDRTGEPTKQGIMDAMSWLASCAKKQPNARLFFQYSGHGTQLPDDNGDEGDDGKDEALVPSDYETKGCLRDDWIFDNLVKPLPADAFLFSIQDCCHSSGVIDIEYKWRWEGEERQFKPKPSVRTRDFSVATKKKADALVIAISGCQDDQTSSDVSSTIDFHHKFGKSMAGSGGGAMSNSAAEVIAEAPTDAEGQPNITYAEFLFRVQESLKRRKFTQKPELTCTKPLDLNQKFSLLHRPSV